MPPASNRVAQRFEKRPFRAAFSFFRVARCSKLGHGHHAERRNGDFDLVDTADTSQASSSTVNDNHVSVALVLGGGGARGLAHIGILEVLDELDVTPTVIAGTSIGAIFGAVYASGLTGGEIRAHTVSVLTRRYELLKDILKTPTFSAKTAFGLLAGRGSLLEPQALLDVVLPDGLPQTFDGLKIPLRVVASDYYALEPRVFAEGPLKPAVAASMALPIIFKPVTIDGRMLLDGGFVNPLPFDVVEDMADLVIAVDVSGTVQKPDDKDHPSAIETIFSLSFLFERSLVREKLKRHQPDIFVEAGTGTFNVLDFLKVEEILEIMEPAKDRFRAQLTRALKAKTVSDASGQ